MVEAAYAHHGVPARFLNCDVAAADLADAVRGARAMGWLGFNCSLPHKVAVIEHLDGLAHSASLIGAVNCIVRREEGWIGENTDGKGFLASLRTIVEPRGRTISVLGAGGAARAIAVELALAGAAELTLVNRDLARAETAAALIRDNSATAARAVAWTAAHRIKEGTEIVVNATSVGLYPDVDQIPDIDLDTITPSMVVCDVIPNPPMTPFLRAAADRGARVLDGRGMLVQQAAVNIGLWTGVEADREIMRAALDSVL